MCTSLSFDVHDFLFGAEGCAPRDTCEGPRRMTFMRMLCMVVAHAVTSDRVLSFSPLHVHVAEGL